MIDARKSPLNAGQYVDSYLPALDGVIMTVRNYARWLNQDHFPCYVATAKAPPGFTDSETYPIYRYQSLPLFSRPPYRFGIPALDRHFVAEGHNLMPDIVHAHTPFFAGAEARRLAHQRKIPLIATFHSKYYDDILAATGSAFLAEQAVRLIIDFFNHADHVWAVSKSTARTLRGYGYKKDFEVMPNGTDFAYPEDQEAALKQVNDFLKISADENIFLYVGQHIRQKNLIMLFQSLKLLADAGQRFRQVMVGDGNIKAELESRAKELEIADKVIFTGAISDRNLLSAIYLRATAFTFPSLYDNSPLVVKEAAMAACPAILIAGSNAAEDTVDGKNAYHCDNSAESLYRALARVMADPALCREIGRQAKTTLARPWREIIGIVARRYTEIITTYKPGPDKWYTRLS